MIFRSLCLLSALLLSTACYRNDSATLLLQIPAASPADLHDLREHLLADHLQLPERLRYFEEITIIDSPPSLRVRYHTRHISARNIEHKVLARGFAVNDLPLLPRP